MADLSVLGEDESKESRGLGGLLYRTSLKGVKDANASWKGNVVTWITYETFADTIKELQAWKLPNDTFFFKMRRSFDIQDEDVDFLRKSTDKKYTSYMLRNNFWNNYGLNSKNENPSGSIEILQKSRKPFEIADWDKFLHVYYGREVEAINVLPFQYTLKNLNKGGFSQMKKFINTIELKNEGKQPKEEFIHKDESHVAKLQGELHSALEEIARLNLIIKQKDAQVAAESIEHRPENVRLDMIELNIIQLADVIKSLKT